MIRETCLHPALNWTKIFKNFLPDKIRKSENLPTLLKQYKRSANLEMQKLIDSQHRRLIYLINGFCVAQTEHDFFCNIDNYFNEYIKIAGLVSQKKHRKVLYEMEFGSTTTIETMIFDLKMTFNSIKIIPCRKYVGYGLRADGTPKKIGKHSKKDEIILSFIERHGEQNTSNIVEYCVLLPDFENHKQVRNCLKKLLQKGVIQRNKGLISLK